MAFEEGMELETLSVAVYCEAFRENVDVSVCQGGCSHFIDIKREQVEQTKAPGMRPETIKVNTLILCSYPRWLAGQKIGTVRKGD